jgi:hypothetical protein
MKMIQTPSEVVVERDEKITIVPFNLHQPFTSQYVVCLIINYVFYLLSKLIINIIDAKFCVRNSFGNSRTLICKCNSFASNVFLDTFASNV